MLEDTFYAGACEMIRQHEREIQEEIERLSSKDEINGEDLERFRQSLPTEPAVAEVVNKALPYPWSEVFEYVHGSDRQAPYWRVRPDRSEPRSEAEREHRKRFSEAAGRRGTVELDGQEVPANAAELGKSLEGERIDTTSSSDSGMRALQRLRSVLFDD